MFPKLGSWALGNMNNWSAGGENKELWMGGWLGGKEPKKEIALALFPGFCLFSSGISSVYEAVPSDLVSMSILSLFSLLFLPGPFCKPHSIYMLPSPWQAGLVCYSEWGRRVGHDWETQQQQQQQPHELEGKI